MRDAEKFLSWAVELQALSQSALQYCKDPYDIERFQRIRQISAEMTACQANMPPEETFDLFCSETGYQTPKLDSRTAVFKNGKILLVQEADGRWALPGGWVDAGLTVAENAVKETLEEAGLYVTPQRVIAVQDRDKNNAGLHAFKICKVFFLCAAHGGSFKENHETTAIGYFSMDDLPTLAEEKTTRKQIAMCFEANLAENWETVFD